MSVTAQKLCPGMGVVAAFGPNLLLDHPCDLSRTQDSC